MWWNRPPANQAENVGGERLPTRSSDEPLEGFRTWRVRNNLDGLALHSLIYDMPWQVENTAECRANSPMPMHVGKSPHLSCACGFYVQLPDHPLTEWEAHVRGRVRASGQVALSGRVIVCERGFKAQYATILSPVYVDMNCAGEGGKCEETVNRILLPGSSKDFWAFCPDHDPAKSEAMVDAKAWLRECVRQLSARYAGIEFLTFYPI